MKKVVAFIMICSILLTGCSVKKVKELTDQEKFAKEFSVSKDNPFTYIKKKDIEKIFNHEGVVFIADSDEEESIKAAELLNEVGKKIKVEKIYYYRPKDKKKELAKYLKDQDELISLPILISFKEGKIVGCSNSLSEKQELSEEKLTSKRIKKIKDEYRKILNKEEYSNCN